MESSSGDKGLVRVGVVVPDTSMLSSDTSLFAENRLDRDIDCLNFLTVPIKGTLEVILDGTRSSVS